MSATEPEDEKEVVVAETADLAGVLPDLPDIDWEAFRAASELARQDLAGSA